MPRIPAPSLPGSGGSPPPGLIPLGGRPRLRDYFRGLWARREFIFNVAAGELKSQHMNSVLGNVWHVLNPLLLIGVYYLIFGVLFQRTRDDLVEAGISYIAFLSVGIFVYGYMQRCFNNGASSIIGNLGLIRSLQFPRAVLPIATVTKEALSFAPSLVVMVVVLVATGEVPSLRWLMFVPVFVMATVFGLGGALVTARLTEQVRDIKNLLPFVFRLGFYLSGVLFSVDQIVSNNPQFEAIGDIFLLNPFYVFISLTREYLLALHSTSQLSMLWLSASLWAGGLLLFGFFFFTAGEKRYGRG